LTAGLVLAATAALLGAGAGDIENFVRVDEKVSTGARLTAGQVEGLRSAGTRVIVDLREPGEIGDPSPADAAAQAGIRYVSIPVKTAEPRDEQVDRFLQVLADPEAYPVFLTCGSGNRVGAFWMIRRMVVDAWTAADAETEGRRIGLKSPHLVEFARSYAARFRGRKDLPSICLSPAGPPAPPALAVTAAMAAVRGSPTAR
jgi:uncharacterized protein (TIGR01244 family)